MPPAIIASPVSTKIGDFDRERRAERRDDVSEGGLGKRAVHLVEYQRGEANRRLDPAVGRGQVPDPAARATRDPCAERHAGHERGEHERLSERRGAGLPPFCHLALLRAEAHKPGQAEAFLDEACGEAEQLLNELHLGGIELLGPVPAPMERRAGRYRAQLLVQANARAPLHRLLNGWLAVLEGMPSGRAVRWSLDVDPIDLF